MAKVKPGKTAARTAKAAGERIQNMRERVRGKVKSRARGVPGPSPDPMTNLVLADIALRGGGMLLRRAVERGLLSARYDGSRAKKIVKGRSLGHTLVSTALAKVATRSVPGAIVVGGGLLAKALYDRARGEKARESGQRKVDKRIRRGE